MDSPPPAAVWLAGILSFITSTTNKLHNNNNTYKIVTIIITVTITILLLLLLLLLYTHMDNSIYPYRQ